MCGHASETLAPHRTFEPTLDVRSHIAHFFTVVRVRWLSIAMAWWLPLVGEGPSEIATAETPRVEDFVAETMFRRDEPQLHDPRALHGRLSCPSPWTGRSFAKDQDPPVVRAPRRDRASHGKVEVLSIVRCRTPFSWIAPLVRD